MFWRGRVVQHQPIGCYPIVVVGSIAVLSDSHYNALLQVDAYLKGDPQNNTLLYQRNKQSYVQLALGGRAHPTQCMNFGEMLPAGRQYIAGLLERNGVCQGTLIPADSDGRFAVEYLDWQTPITTDYAGLIAYISQRESLTAHLPVSQVKPRAVTVELTTDTGARYYLPVQGRSLVPVGRTVNRSCETETQFFRCNSMISAPNHIDYAYFIEPSPDSEESIVLWDEPYGNLFYGSTGVFSIDSDLIAVWGQDDTQLQVYGTRCQPSLGNWLWSSNVPPRLNSVNESAVGRLLPGAGAWSPSGRTLAFSTEAGVWLWDAVYSNTEPRLLLTSDGEPNRVLHFSPRGSYLALQAGIRRYHIDITTSEVYPDGLFSPDDRQLMVFDTQADELRPHMLYRMIPNFMLVSGWVVRSPAPQMSQFEWIEDSNYQDGDYFALTCGAFARDPDRAGQFQYESSHP